MENAQEHPLGMMITAAVRGGYDFMVVLGGDRALRQRMGLPKSVAERDPLLLTFPATWHGYSKPSPEDSGMTCVLSFDALYECRFPWSCIVQVVVQNQGEAAWPAAWETASSGDTVVPTLAPASAPEEAQPSNVRQFRPRAKKPE